MLTFVTSSEIINTSSDKLTKRGCGKRPSSTWICYNHNLNVYVMFFIDTSTQLSFEIKLLQQNQIHISPTN